MLSFTSRLSSECNAFAIFVTEKYSYKDPKNILPNNIVQKINSYLGVLKAKKKEEEISFFDISNQQKCFIIKVKSKHESYYPEEIGGTLFSCIKQFKEIKKVELYADSLTLDSEKIQMHFSSPSKAAIITPNDKNESENILLSYPRSGNHLVRFFIELLSEIPTYGCKGNKNDIEIYRNVFPEKIPFNISDFDKKDCYIKYHFPPSQNIHSNKYSEHLIDLY